MAPPDEALARDSRDATANDPVCNSNSNSKPDPHPDSRQGSNLDSASSPRPAPTADKQSSSSSSPLPPRPAPLPLPSASPASPAPPAPPAAAPAPQAAVSSSTIASPSTAAALVSRPQQNGDGRAPESESGPAATPSSDPDPDSDMSNHRPGGYHGGPPGAPAPSHHHGGLPPSYPHSASVPSSSAPAYQPATSMPTTQYASYPSATAPSIPSDAYRASPVGSNAMSLPSMRTIDSMQQPPGSLASQGMPHHSVSMAMNSPLAPAAGGGQPFYSHHSVPLASNYGLSPEAMARYPLPHDPRLTGSRGAKKEIKRRTKTGCLTCRRRRIKCDETHPSCNNCKKSKRDCLGYDPIFRQQPAGPSSSHIQPAPTSQLTPPPSVPPPVPTNAPPGVVPRPNNSYGSQPSMLVSSYAPSLSSAPAPAPIPSSVGYNPTLASNAPPTAVKTESGYEHGAHAENTVRQLPSTTVQDSSRPYDHKAYGDNNFHLRAQKMRIDQIIDLLGPPPPAQQISHTEETFNEITKVYHEMYAGGLSAFMETTWYYFAENGQMSFPKDAALIEHMASFLKILEAVKANDHAQMAYSGVVETRIVWQLARTAYNLPERSNSSMRMSLPPEGDPTEARNRLQVIEALLCGDYLAANPLAPPVHDADQHRTRQFDFWYSLAEFVRRRDNPNSPATVNAREDVLSRMRHLLDGRENRDVLYSIAVVRELAPNFDPMYGNSIPQHLDETDPKNRLAVASKFIMDESQVTGGTTNVVRRFSDIASRAFVNPGVNVARRVA